jgi:hypothetical protein
MKRGAVRKSDCRMLTVWVPNRLLPYIDVGLARLDTDRSKFIRNAIREKLARNGVQVALPE